jgi:peptidoglycan/xylan/chitin deacetylase (PgdA/CDA1 family)
MDFLMRHFTPLHIDDLISGRMHERTNYFMLSFDDGLAEMYDIVKPILLEKGIPATFFVNSAFVNNHALFYRYKISLLIDAFPEPILAEKMLLVEEMKFVAGRSPVQHLRQLHSYEDHLVNALAEHLGFDFMHYLHHNKPYMRVDQLQDLHHNGFAIGAHSVDHPYFSEISPEAQLSQIQQSAQFVREACNISHPAFAFPFTAVGAAPQLFETMYHDAGISLSFGTGGIQKKIFPKHIDRIPAEYRDWSLETIVKSEYAYYITKKRFGK